jgi:exodeoxyribonuclease V beta subunit
MTSPLRYPKPPELAKLGTRHAVVEASAGTGKTYVLEHLVIDLLLTRGATLDQILVVTFTEKATAELTDRVRRKLEELESLSAGHPLAIPVLVAESGAPSDSADDACWLIDERARRKLREALFAFDRASISTIHGFCQRLLSEHAFANRRLFNEEAIDEDEAFHSAFSETLRRDVGPDPAVQPFLEAWLAAGKSLGDLESRFLSRVRRGLASLYPPRPDAVRPGSLDQAAVVSKRVCGAAGSRGPHRARW